MLQCVLGANALASILQKNGVKAVNKAAAVVAHDHFEKTLGTASDGAKEGVVSIS
jgi:hypothetical protein